LSDGERRVWEKEKNMASFSFAKITGENLKSSKKRNSPC
jgi:hypothetical protein